MPDPENPEVPKSIMREPLAALFDVTHHTSKVTSEFVSNKWPGNWTNPAPSGMTTEPLTMAADPLKVALEPAIESVPSEAKLYRCCNVGPELAKTVMLVVPVTLRKVALMVAVPGLTAVTSPY